MVNKISIILFLFASLFTANAQVNDTIYLSLDKAIERGRTKSVAAESAINTLRSYYWEYRSYKASLLPEMNFEATLPSYSKSYGAYQLDDGSYTFVRNNHLDMSGSLSIDQNIWLTGGTLSIISSLDFYRQFGNNTGNNFKSIPVAITLSQPIFGVNTVKWDRKIEPLRYEEAKADYIESSEKVALTAITYYFNLLSDKESVSIAKQNLENAKHLYNVALAKRNMGQISKNDVLQLKLNVLDAQSELTDAVSTMKSDMFRLRTFLDYGENVVIEPIIPEKFANISLNYDDVLQKALEHNSFSKNIRRRQLEADYDVAKAKGDLRQITLYAQVGFTGTSNEFNDAYNHLKDNQIVEVGVKIPLIDWGKRRGKVKVAQSNRNLIQSQLRQEAIEFNQDIFILVERFNNQQSQVEIAMTSDTIARKRYETNVETFLRGKISTLDLNDSRVTKDKSRLEYISNLYKYWYYYYQIRSLSLWDYIQNKPLEVDFEEII
ncbi:MAG: TolC family protein [Bacteroidales bacterium]|nr:TolC family protein [Bacteroidales bacterium]